MRRLALIAALILLTASQARAAENVPGSACGTAPYVTNTWQWAGGKENGGVINGMFCNGSTWQSGINFQSTGYVGIGTTTPAGILDVRGTVTTPGAGVSGTSINLYAQNGGTGSTNGGNINLVPGTGNWHGSVNIGSPSFDDNTVNVNGSIVLGNNNDYYARDTSGNDVILAGITSGNNIEYGGSTVSGSVQFFIPNATGGFQFLTGAGNTNVMQITNGGSVGIGQTSPATKLDVNGDITNENVKSCSHLGTDSTGKLICTSDYIGGLSLVGKASCNWTITTSWASMTANASCNALTADGSATSPGKYPAITFASLPAGTYRVTFNIPFDSSTGCAFRISDGTNTAGISHVISDAGDYVVGTFTYASTQTNITFSLQGKAAASSACTVYGDAATTGLLVTDFVSKFYVEKL